MPRKPPPVWPKGTRPPNSGRAKGTPNKISVEARLLVSELVSNPKYQQRLRRDFELRRVHPTIEALIWSYHLGKPRQDITLNATVDVNAKLDEERRVLATLDLPDLEQVAAESQALVDRAMSLARLRAERSLPQPVVVKSEPTNASRKST